MRGGKGRKAREVFPTDQGRHNVGHELLNARDHSNWSPTIAIGIGRVGPTNTATSKYQRPTGSDEGRRIARERMAIHIRKGAGPKNLEIVGSTRKHGINLVAHQ